MKSVAKILTEIDYWTNQYYKAREGADIDGLLDIQDEIAIRSYTLAKHVADYKKSYNGAYFIRQVGVAKSSLQHQKNGLKIGTADKQALIDNEANYEIEQAHEATAVQLDLILRQTNRILDVITQRISHYKAERGMTNRQNQT